MEIKLKRHKYRTAACLTDQQPSLRLAPFRQDKNNNNIARLILFFAPHKASNGRISYGVWKTAAGPPHRAQT